MTTEREGRPPSAPPRPAPAADLRRIPLPALPHFRRPETNRAEAAAGATVPDVAASPAPSSGPAAPVSHVEMSELLAPGHDGGIAPAIDWAVPQRTGATGATILNDLVDEIEKGLEREIARAPLEITSQGYRRVVACSSGPALPDAAGPAAGGAPPPGHPRRSDV